MGVVTVINWRLIQELAGKPHKHLNIVEGAQYGLMVDGVFSVACNGVCEVMCEARAVQHLCDLAGVPEGEGADAPHIDARVFLLVAEVVELRERLARIAGWHSRENAEGGMVDDFCVECQTKCPCDTQRLAVGTHEGEATSC
jgi:hypothetical protein